MSRYSGQTPKISSTNVNEETKIPLVSQIDSVLKSFTVKKNEKAKPLMIDVKVIAKRDFSTPR